MSPVRNTASRTPRSRMCAKHLAPVGGVAVPLVDVVGQPVVGQQTGDVVDRARARPGAAGRTTTGAIITGLPTSFHWGPPVRRPSLSQSSCSRPVIVRSGSLISASAAGPPGAGHRGGDLLVAVGAQVEHAQLGERAELQPPEQPGAVAEVGGAVHPHRHPLVVRPVRAGPAGRVVALGRAGGSRAPSFHWSLVTSWSSQVTTKGYFACSALEVGVGLVLRVPPPVVGRGRPSRGPGRDGGCPRWTIRSRTRRARTRRGSRRGAAPRRRSSRAARCR